MVVGSGDFVSGRLAIAFALGVVGGEGGIGVFIGVISVVGGCRRFHRSQWSRSKVHWRCMVL